MAYTALYRKFRPQTFDSVIGQDYIVKTLKNQIKTERVSHAYLFCGTRGTGKTSTAKIFARAINCINLTEDGEPCNECALCQDILAGRSVNVIEIDAASNNGVDNIREIREEVKYPPTQGRFKVYIVDEVHMLSTAAFNALLKTLEEPPAHVIFILATTDPQKVPATILSRVQRFDFRRITTETIAQTMMGYLKEEGHRATLEAVRYVAQLGDGSMRDSLSILDQCLAFFSGEEVTLEKVLDIMGAVDQTIFFEMAEALAQKDAKKAMTLVEEMMLSGRDVKQFVTEMLQHLRNLLMAATISDAGAVLDLSKENADRLQGAAKVLSPEEIIYLIGKFSDLQSEMKWAPNERILLEVELMKLCAPWTEKDVTTLAARLGELERKVSEGVQVVTVAASDNAKPAEKPKPKRRPPAAPEDVKKVQDQWAILCGEVDDKMLKGTLRDTKIQFKEDNALYLICDNVVAANLLERNLDQIHGLLEKAADKSFDVHVIVKKEYDDWYERNFGKAEEFSTEEEDAEFASLLGAYFPEADIE
ncbi:MAG: DNA polymerase III subunit gamma/tau [Anaerotignum sp.]|nr:DNA polymerase III subunit gamma/tau [Anaerotignum sp.]